MQIAAANARHAGVEISWLHAAVEKADLPQDFFDIALSVTCLQHITDRERQMEATRRILRSLKPGGVFVLVEDTPLRDSVVSDYMVTYPQHDWISLVQSQGAEVRNFLGISFLRFDCFSRLPPQVAVAIDLMLSHIRWFRTHEGPSQHSLS